jgi:hypothetical protein
VILDCDPALPLEGEAPTLVVERERRLMPLEPRAGAFQPSADGFFARFRVGPEAEAVSLLVEGGGAFLLREVRLGHSTLGALSDLNSRVVGDESAVAAIGFRPERASSGRPTGNDE